MNVIDKIDYSKNQKQLTALNQLKNPDKKYYLFWGGSRSGKTYLSIRFIRLRALIYPKSKHLVCRYSFANAKKTIWLQTMLPEFRKDEDLGLCKIKENEGVIEYKNGSIVRLGGLEPSSISSILSSEYGTIFINEANENKYSVIEDLFTRLNDTAKAKDGRMIPLKLICDLNPLTIKHWDYLLFHRGLDPMTLQPRADFVQFSNLHFSPYDNIQNLSPGYIQILENLSPGKKLRFLKGEYGSLEGLVYSGFDESVHVVDDFQIPATWKKMRGIDFGYTHPFVCLWAAYDPVSDCIYFYREYVREKITVRAHSEEIKKLSILDLPEEKRNSSEAWKFANELYSKTVADHDAEDRATLWENGVFTDKANKEVLAGIDHVIDLLDFSDGKRPRIKIFRSCSNLISEFYSYRWADNAMSGKRSKDRLVIKDVDDCVDTLRYIAVELIGMAGGFKFQAIRAR